MEGVARELATGVAGSLIGALLVFLFSLSLKITTSSRERQKKLKEQEIIDWKSGDLLKRQIIFNKYIFSVLKFFVIGSILIGVTNAAGDLYAVPRDAPLRFTDYMFFVLDTIAVVFYFATFAQILEFTRLLRERSLPNSPNVRAEAAISAQTEATPPA